MSDGRRRWTIALATACLTTTTASAQKARSAGARAPTDSALAAELTAGEGDAEPLRRQLLGRPEWNLGFMTLHIGGGLLFDGVAYS